MKRKIRTLQQPDTRYIIQQQVRLGRGTFVLIGVVTLLALLFMMSL